MPKTKKAYACPECDREFDSSQGLAAHTRAHKDEALPCAVCGRICPSPQALGSHLRTHRNDGASEPQPRGKAKASRVRMLQDGLRLARLVQELYPDGIPTDDTEALHDDLRLIRTLEQKIGGAR